MNIISPSKFLLIFEVNRIVEINGRERKMLNGENTARELNCISRRMLQARVKTLSWRFCRGCGEKIHFGSYCQECAESSVVITVQPTHEDDNLQMADY